MKTYFRESDGLDSLCRHVSYPAANVLIISALWLFFVLLRSSSSVFYLLASLTLVGLNLVLV
jgi:hypothetical protein